jgi:hypothetical protein
MAGLVIQLNCGHLLFREASPICTAKHPFLFSTYFWSVHFKMSNDIHSITMTCCTVTSVRIVTVQLNNVLAFLNWMNHYRFI